ncbi:unnamed protein product, partial [Prorocentrum cordatum]
ERLFGEVYGVDDRALRLGAEADERKRRWVQGKKGFEQRIGLLEDKRRAAAATRIQSMWRRAAARRAVERRRAEQRRRRAQEAQRREEAWQGLVEAQPALEATSRRRRARLEAEGALLERARLRESSAAVVQSRHHFAAGQVAAAAQQQEPTAGSHAAVAGSDGLLRVGAPAPRGQEATPRELARARGEAKEVQAMVAKRTQAGGCHRGADKLDRPARPLHPHAWAQARAVLDKAVRAADVLQAVQGQVGEAAMDIWCSSCGKGGLDRLGSHPTKTNIVTNQPRYRDRPLPRDRLEHMAMCAGVSSLRRDLALSTMAEAIAWHI